MAFQRREGVVGGNITKYADTKISKCPFCGTQHPQWLTDAYIANYSLIASKCVNGYKFKCSKCDGVFEIHANTDFCFQNETFSLVKLVDGGHGTKNLDKIGTPITIHELKRLSSEAVEEDQGIVLNEDSDEIKVNISKEFDYEDESLNEYLASIKLDDDVIKISEEPKTKFCGVCGSKLDIDGLCPRCSKGLAPQYVQKPQQSPQQSKPQQAYENTSMTHGILSLVFGILSLYCCFFVFAIIGLVQASKAQGTKGAKLGIAGRVVSIFGLIFSIIIVLYIFIYMGLILSMF